MLTCSFNRSMMKWRLSLPRALDSKAFFAKRFGYCRNSARWLGIALTPGVRLRECFCSGSIRSRVGKAGVRPGEGPGPLAGATAVEYPPANAAARTLSADDAR